MTTTNPDKWIRKAVYELVSGANIPCFDTRVSNNQNITDYVLLTSQTKEVSKANKCEYRWETSLLIEIYNKQSSAGNPGSRYSVNETEQVIYTLLQTQLFIQGFEVLIQNITFETQLETVTDTENIFRSFLRLNLTLI